MAPDTDRPDAVPDRDVVARMTKLRIDRRTFLKTAATTATLLLAARPMLAQSDPLLEPDPEGTVERVAFDLDADPEAIFRFVSEKVRFEPYVGALRGAKGTLLSGAGSSADQALLLAGLLQASAVTTRFAIGRIDARTADSLTQSAVLDRDGARQEFLDALTGSGQSVADASPSPSPAAADVPTSVLDGIERGRARGDEVVAWIAGQVDQTGTDARLGVERRRCRHPDVVPVASRARAIASRLGAGAMG